MSQPSYVGLWKSGELEIKVERARSLLSVCRVCPRRCVVDRTCGETGYCGAGLLPAISGYGPHFGEEPPLVGRYGSGTIFFSGCNMHCLFCQNFQISHLRRGSTISTETLAGIMIRLQEQSCHNINLVSPTHFVPQILESVQVAAERGLDIPLVYNTGTYDTVDTLRLLDGVVDIYMPDAKYGRDDIALALSDTPGYTGIMKAALLEMQRQVGDLVIEDGIAVRGLIIRHLVLPDDLAATGSVMEYIAGNISKDAYVNIMNQYHWNDSIPSKIFTERFPEVESLLRSVRYEEYKRALQSAKNFGLSRGFSPES